MKVKSINRIGHDTPVRVYDLEVETDHTFIVECGLIVHNSAICQDRDGQIYIYNEKDYEKYGSGKGMLPGEVMSPAHYGCRSTTTPLTRSWEDLRIPMKDKLKVPEGTRASINGQVSESLNYNGWFKIQPAAVQKDILGTPRYDLWKAGKVTDLSKFHTSTGRMLTLKQLAIRLN